MPDWSKSMSQSFEYHLVDPGTWRDYKKLSTVTNSTINRDLEAETLGSASLDVTESVGECYIRIYLITVQNELTEKHALGTFLVQTPSSSFDGKIRNITMDAYTPLIELKENPPPLGYALLKSENIMTTASRLCRENVRAPVVATENTSTLHDDFVANTDDTWLTFISDLIANAKYSLALDEMGRVLFAPNQDTASLQPVKTFDDSNSSILYPEFDMEHDLYGVPNIVEVTYSKGGYYYHARVVNDDENSPTSTVNRGREIIYRVTNPESLGNATQNQVNEHANQLLRELSSLEYTITYSHGYCPVRIGDCVRLNYARAGIVDVKAKVISQSIECTPGCKVTEKAVFTTKLWG